MEYVPLLPEQIPSLGERERIRDALLEDVTSLAARSEDSQAGAVVQLLQERLVLRLPLPNGVVGYDSRPVVSPDRAVFLVLVKSLDVWQLEEDAPARRFAKPNRFVTMTGAYYLSTRTIYLPADWQLGRFWLSLALLHEGMHAYDHLVRHSTSERSRWRRELRARQLEYRVLCRLQDGRWLQLLASPTLQQQVRQALAARDPLRLFAPTKADVSEQMLDQLFGEAVSASDRHYRRVVVGRCIVQHQLAMCPVGAREQKLAVT